MTPPPTPPPATVAVITAAPAARADPFCKAVREAAGSAAIGFVTIRGPAVAASSTRLQDTYQTRVAIPGATGCSIIVPRGPARGAPAYACNFSGGLDVGRAMGRLVRRTARCVQIGVGNPPRLKPGPQGPSFYFPSGIARFDFSAAPRAGAPRLWAVTLAISRGPHRSGRPTA